jgi:putative ABC transport system substrate-binding protein
MRRYLPLARNRKSDGLILDGRYARLLRYLSACVVAAMSLAAHAARVSVVLSDNAQPYEEVFEAIQAQLVSRHHVVIRQVADALGKAMDPASSDLLVAVGVDAAESIARSQTKKPVLAVLVPRDWYVHGGDNLLVSDKRSFSALFIDQPFPRQMRLISKALPLAKTVGVVVSPEQAWQLPDLKAAARQFHFKLDEAITHSDTRLVQSLEQVLPSSDLLLALPDASVLNRTTAQTFFLTAYRYRVPVVGYSHSITTAGALCSIYSTPKQIGRQAGEILLKALSGDPVRLPAPQYPKYFSISVNTHVARSLGISLPDEQTLIRQTGAEGE